MLSLRIRWRTNVSMGGAGRPTEVVGYPEEEEPDDGNRELTEIPAETGPRDGVRTSLPGVRSPVESEWSLPGAPLMPQAQGPSAEFGPLRSECEEMQV